MVLPSGPKVVVVIISTSGSLLEAIIFRGSGRSSGLGRKGMEPIAYLPNVLLCSGQSAKRTKRAP